MFELLLLSVVVSTAYLGAMILKRFGPHQRVYGIMIVADLALALGAFIARTGKGPSPMADAVGTIAIGAAFCLIMLPPMVRDLGRRFMAADRLRLARLMSELRELLQPGMGARSESELIETVLAVRSGREQEVVDALEARKVRISDPALRQVLDERIVMTYLYAQRWSEAVTHYERLATGGRRPASPQLSVEMVRAYCEDEQLEKAAELMNRIEESPLASEPILLTLVARARMVFLAFVGRTGAVEAIVGPGGPLAQMPEAARSFWSGIARLNAGDTSGARSSLHEAARLSSNDPRALKVAQQQLARLDVPSEIGPHALSIEVAALADRLTSTSSKARVVKARAQGTERPLPRLTSVPLRVMPVTATIAAANLLASMLVYLAFDSITDLGGLIASGANLKSATLAGEWWRLGTSMFLHVGVAHLALNVYGLWVLGRLVEQIYGSLRTLAIYAMSGIAGALASTYLGDAATAVGASGAVLGLMGAAVAELAVYRRHYPKHWSKPLLGMLVLLSIAQIAIGFFYPIVDQWGHVGGLFGGALVGLSLSRHARIGARTRSGAAYVLAALSAGCFAYAAFSVATSSYTQTLRGYPTVRQHVGGLAIEVPASWEKVSPRELYDPGTAALLDLRRLPAAAGLDATISARLESEHQGGALRAGFDRAKPAATSKLRLPSPWRGGELEVSVDGASGMQHYRLVVFGRIVGDEIWLGAYYHPAALTVLIEPVLSDALTSIVEHNGL